MEVQNGNSHYKISVRVARVQMLIERGSKLKSEGRVRDYYEWAHFILVLKNEYREIISET